MSSLPVSEYQVGIVCALSKEMAAVVAVMDEEHESLKEKDAQDHNSYMLGRIHLHNVVVACLPAGVDGNNAAATVAKDMLRTFTGVRIGLMVGIGGGIPNLPKDDIRLGDVVVSQPDKTYGGVVQYDLGKSLEGGSFERKGSLDRPRDALLTALSALQTRHLLRPSQVPAYIQEAGLKYPLMLDKGYGHPGTDQDHLHCTQCDPPQEPGASLPCNACDNGQVLRISRSNTNPVIHYGTIASGNKLIKDAASRDRLRQEFEAKCVEMEAAGLMNEFRCVVIRGICDYADSYKNDVWQEYAALTAAAFARELLLYVVPERVNAEKPLREVISK
jgi:nucleoside phosphorylase